MKKLRLATVGVVTLKKEIIESSDFLAAKKNGDTKAAERVIDLVWKEKKTTHLSEHVNENTVFLSMPSTTRTNIIPAIMAKRHSDKFLRPFVYGDELFDVLHNTASKDIPRDRRIFSPREYGVADKQGVNELLKGKQIVIVDDLITTGSSIRNFTNFLREKGLDVTHAVALMGDRRLALDPVTERKLDAVLQEKEINIPIENINHITRSEAGGLIRRLNGVKRKDGIQKITEDLQRLQRRATINNSQGNTTGGDYGTQRTNSGNKQLGERIPTYTSSPASSTKKIETQWKNILDAERKAIIERVKSLTATTIKNIDRQEKRINKHQLSKPKSIFVLNKKATFKWERISISLQKRSKSLHRRLDFLQSFKDKNKVLIGFSDNIERIATSRATKKDEGLHKQYIQLRQQERFKNRKTVKATNNKKRKSRSR